MSKFQVVKCELASGIGKTGTAWNGTRVKGLFTDDNGEMDMVDLLLFPERGQSPVLYQPNEHLIPLIGVGRNKANNRPEFSIVGFKPVAVASAKAAA